MTTPEVLAAAVAAIIGAALALAIPWWVLVGGFLLVVLTRRPAAVVVLVLVASSLLASRAEAGLIATPAVVGGRAEVVMDPEPRPGGWVTELSWAGRRWRAFLPYGAGPPRSSTAPRSSTTTDLARLRVGDVVSVHGRTGRLTASWEWRRARHLAGRIVVRSIEFVDAGAWWWRLANDARATVGGGLDSFSLDDRALFLGVLLGDDREQSSVMRFRFRASGLSHVTAVSGQNVAYLLTVASPVLRRLRLASRWAVTGALLAWFALVTRLEPSVLRAVAMAGVAATASFAGRYATGLRVLGVAVIVVVLADPLLVWSAGFRLSVAASAGLLVAAGPAADAVRGPRWWAGAVAVAAVAQAATAPLLVELGGTVPTLGVAANLLGVPIAGALMVWGLATAPVAGLVGGPVATVLGVPSRLGCVALRSIAAWFADPGLPRWAWPGTIGWALVVIGVVLGRQRSTGAGRPRRLSVRVSTSSPRSSRGRWWTAVACVGAFACLVDGSGLGPGPFAPERSVSARGIQVWAAPGASVLVIGAGAAEDDALAALLRCRCGRIDAVLVTGGGRSAAGVVWALRQVVDVGEVLAVDPTQIRDARPLGVGRLRVGALVVVIERSEGPPRARVASPP